MNFIRSMFNNTKWKIYENSFSILCIQGPSEFSIKGFDTNKFRVKFKNTSFAGHIINMLLHPIIRLGIIEIMECQDVKFHESEGINIPVNLLIMNECDGETPFNYRWMIRNNEFTNSENVICLNENITVSTGRIATSMLGEMKIRSEELSESIIMFYEMDDEIRNAISCYNYGIHDGAPSTRKRVGIYDGAPSTRERVVTCKKVRPILSSQFEIFATSKSNGELKITIWKKLEWKLFLYSNRKVKILGGSFEDVYPILDKLIDIDTLIWTTNGKTNSTSELGICAKRLIVYGDISKMNINFDILIHKTAEEMSTHLVKDFDELSKINISQNEYPNLKVLFVKDVPKTGNLCNQSWISTVIESCENGYRIHRNLESTRSEFLCELPSEYMLKNYA